MPFHYKALILVLVITTVMFMLTKPLFVTFMMPTDFDRRRNVWFALTLVAFLSPSIWLYMGVAAALIVFSAKKDSNPVALYMFLLLAVPPVREYVPSFGLVKQVIALDHLRLLSLVLLLPMAVRALGPQGAEDGVERKRSAAGTLLVLYALIQLALMFPYQSMTASLRRALELSMELLLPYFVVAGGCRSREAIVEAMACFALGMMAIAPLAMLEFAKAALLYSGIEDRWGTAHMIGYLMRGDFLRAQVTAGHSIVLGFAMATALGFWLYLQNHVNVRSWRWFGLLMLGAGLIVTLARGPWVGALCIVVLFLALGPNGAARSFKALALMTVVAAIALASPWGSSIVDHLPFIGTLDDRSVTYRQRLVELSWKLIHQNPLLGTPYFMAYMEELRQGEGIIDMVNTYAGIALSYGLVGLSFFVSFFAVVMARCFNTIRRFSDIDADYAAMGACLLACIGGALVMIATLSNYLSVPYIHLALAGLASAYARLAAEQRVGPGIAALSTGRMDRWPIQPNPRGSHAASHWDT